MHITSKLPSQGPHIFSYMSGLANQYNAVNLSQGFPNFEPSKVLLDLVTHSLGENTNQYAPMAGILPLREEIAKMADRNFGISVDHETEVTIGCGATELIFNALTAFIWPGDEVLLIEPGYDCYVPAILLAGAKPISCKMKAPDFTIDWQEVRSLVTTRTRMICFSTPNNPTGKLMTAHDMEMLSSIVKGTDILVLSDEVYEQMVFDGRKHISPLMYPELRERTIAVYSFGKMLHITGWRIGYSMAAKQLTDELRKVHQYNVFSVSHPLQKAIASYLGSSDDYSNLALFYGQKRDLFRSLLQQTRLRLLPCEGSYFQLADYSSISGEGDLMFCERLVREFGVAAIPVSRLYSEPTDNRLIRFCFAKTNDTLNEAGKRLNLL